MPRLGTTRVRIVVFAACLAAAAPAVNATTPLLAVRYASDIAVLLGGTAITPADVAEDDLMGMVTPVDVGPIPRDAHIDAYQLLSNGDQLLSFDTTIELPGGVVARPADVVRFDGAAYSIAFDGTANGIPEGVNTDAVAVFEGDLLLSFDTSVSLSGTSFEDEDLVRFKSAGASFEPFFNGASAGVPSDLDLDGAQVLGTSLFLSFDGSGTIGGIPINDDDVLEFDGTVFTIAYSGAMHHAEWGAADLLALYVLPLASPTPTATGSIPATATATATTSGTPATATETPIVSVTPTAIGCAGDCDGSGVVTVDDLVKLVNIALGNLPVTTCLAGDTNGDGQIAINEIIAAVNRALSSC